ncbi:MAG: spermidine synthase, partial [Candidatus Eremiobacterota bacterium]
MLARSAVSLVLAVLTLAPLRAAPAEEKVLFSRSSLFNGTVLVVQQGPYRILQFRDEGQVTEQSRCEVSRPDRLLHEYTRIQLLGLCFRPGPRRILVVGLGGASLSKALARLCPTAVIDNVEIDPIVVDAARAYFFYREGPRMRTFAEDARVYAARCRESYDLIFLDAF